MKACIHKTKGEVMFPSHKNSKTLRNFLFPFQNFSKCLYEKWEQITPEQLLFEWSKWFLRRPMTKFLLLPNKSDSLC